MESGEEDLLAEYRNFTTRLAKLSTKLDHITRNISCDGSRRSKRRVDTKRVKIARRVTVGQTTDELAGVGKDSDTLASQVPWGAAVASRLRDVMPSQLALISPS